MSESEGYACAHLKFSEAADAGSASAAFRLAEMAHFGEISVESSPASSSSSRTHEGHTSDAGGSVLSGSHGEVWEMYGRASDMGSAESAYVMATVFALNSSAAAAQCVASAGGDAESRGRVHEEIAVALFREAATRGSELGLLAVGRRHYEASGAGVLQGERNEEQCLAAFEWYRAAAELAVKAIQTSGGADAETEQVRLSEVEWDVKRDEREGDDEREFLRTKADRGFGKEAAVAQLAVAVRKFHGVKGSEKDLAGSAHYMQKAAEKSTEEDGGALANYGYMLANGWGVQVDVPAAVAKFERATELGEAGGWVGLGYVHYYGLGNVSANKTLALALYQRAAKMGDAQGLFNVGEMLRQGEGTAEGLPNREAALEHFHAAAVRGHFKAYYMMGLSYWFGWGTPASCADAIFLLKIVAERGPSGRVLRDAYSLYKAGQERKALLLYLRAAEAGYEIAHNNAAYILRKNTGALGFHSEAQAETEKNQSDSRNTDKSRRCAEKLAELILERAVMQGSSEAAVTLGDIMRDNGDASQAVTYYERALSQRDAKYMTRAAVSLGRMYEKGEAGLQVDTQKAKSLYQLAREAGGEGEVAALAAEALMEVSESVTGLVESVTDLGDSLSSALGSFSSWISSAFTKTRTKPV